MIISPAIAAAMPIISIGLRLDVPAYWSCKVQTLRKIMIEAPRKRIFLGTAFASFLYSSQEFVPKRSACFLAFVAILVYVYALSDWFESQSFHYFSPEFLDTFGIVVSYPSASLADNVDVRRGVGIIARDAIAELEFLQ
jgi:hypothetical protein